MKHGKGLAWAAGLGTLAVLLVLWALRYWGLFRLPLPLFLLSSNAFLVQVCALAVYFVWRVFARQRGAERAAGILGLAMLLGALLLVQEVPSPLLFQEELEDKPVVLAEDLGLEGWPQGIRRASVLLEVTQLVYLAEFSEVRYDCRAPWVAALVMGQAREGMQAPLDLGFDQAYGWRANGGGFLLLRQGPTVFWIGGIDYQRDGMVPMLWDSLELEAPGKGGDGHEGGT